MVPAHHVRLRAAQARMLHLSSSSVIAEQILPVVLSKYRVPVISGAGTYM